MTFHVILGIITCGMNVGCTALCNYLESVVDVLSIETFVINLHGMTWVGGVILIDYG
jgi:hypothetical protein